MTDQGPPQTDSSVDPEGGPGSIRVLHVDDDSGFASVVATLLEERSEAITVATETSPEAAIDRIRDGERVDCVVSDYDMAGMNGLELLRAVREERSGLPFVLFTGTGSEEIASEAISAGVTDYLQKGSGDEYTVLANRVSNAVAQRRASDRLRSRVGQQAVVAELGQTALYLDAEDIGTLFEETVTAVARALEASHSGLFECRSESSDLLLRSGVDCPEADGPLPADDGSFAGYTLGTGGPTVVEDVAAEDRFAGAGALADHGVESALGVVVGDRDDPWGVLAVYDRRPREFGEEDVTFARSVANLLGTAIERAERERRHSTLISNLPGIVYRCANDPDWPMEFVGGQCEELTGYPASVIESNEVVWGREVLHPDDREWVWDEVQVAIDEREPFEITYRIHTKDGQQRWMWEQGRGIYSADGDLEALEGFITDVTERKAYERRLERERDRLDGFASVVSHDLRNPIEVANAEVALARAEGRDDEHLDRIDDALARMNGIIDDVLTLARQDLDTDDERIDLGPVAVETWQAVGTPPDRFEVVEDPGPILGDGGQTRRLLENLFRNAVEHGGRGDPNAARSDEDGVTVSLGPVFEQGTFVGFYVADDGEGVPSADAERVFEPGYSSAETGTGLGLAIVRRVAEAHGWSVGVTESEAGGARFEVTGVDRPPV